MRDLLIIFNIFFFGFIIGLWVESYWLVHKPNYYIDTCLKQNYKHDDAKARCEQSYQIFRGR